MGNVSLHFTGALRGHTHPPSPMGAFGAPMDSPRLDHAHSSLTHFLGDKLSAPIFFIGKPGEAICSNQFICVITFFLWARLSPSKNHWRAYVLCHCYCYCLLLLLLLLLTAIAIAIAYSYCYCTLVHLCCKETRAAPGGVLRPAPHPPMHPP